MFQVDRFVGQVVFSSSSFARDGKMPRGGPRTVDLMIHFIVVVWRRTGHSANLVSSFAKLRCSRESPVDLQVAKEFARDKRVCVFGCDY